MDEDTDEGKSAAMRPWVVALLIAGSLIFLIVFCVLYAYFHWTGSAT